jgi:hypothetical protein
VDERTLYLMFVFNFFLVLLASCIAGSLYATVADILKSGWCALIVILGRTLPEQSSFFLNYLLQDALLITPLVDLLQVCTHPHPLNPPCSHIAPQHPSTSQTSPYVESVIVAMFQVRARTCEHGFFSPAQRRVPAQGTQAIAGSFTTQPDAGSAFLSFPMGDQVWGAGNLGLLNISPLHLPFSIPPHL